MTQDRHSDPLLRAKISKRGRATMHSDTHIHLAIQLLRAQHLLNTSNHSFGAFDGHPRKSDLSFLCIYEPDSHQAIACKFVDLTARTSDELDLHLCQTPTARPGHSGS